MLRNVAPYLFAQAQWHLRRERAQLLDIRDPVYRVGVWKHVQGSLLGTDKAGCEIHVGRRVVLREGHPSGLQVISSQLNCLVRVVVCIRHRPAASSYSQ